MKNILFLVIAGAFFLLSSCDKDDAMENPEPTPNAVKLTNTTDIGMILTDHEGRSLYFFSRDSKGVSTCSGGCLGAWPIFYTEELTLDDGLDEADFKVITTDNGDKQTTYKGWPLYYFANDTEPGMVNGDGANNVWYAAKPDYTVMMVNAQLIGANGTNYVVNDTGSFVEGEGNTFYLTDERGRTLYGFAPDKYDKNNYTKEDFSNDGNWPIYETELTAITSNLSTDDFNVIDVFGKNQLTFRGWPLYYFGKDESPGDNKGISIPRPGVWPVVNEDTQYAPIQ